MEYWNSIVEFFHKSGKTDPFAITGFIIGIVANIPYIISVIKRQSKPAISSWFLWSMLSIVTLLSAYKAGKIYPQMVVFAILDPVIFFVAVFMRQSSPFEKEDWMALIIGLISIVIIYFSPSLALVGSLVGVTFANIPPIKNVVKNPQAENLSAWLLFTFAATSSFLSGTIYFTSWIDVLAPFTYMTLCVITLFVLFYKRSFGDGAFLTGLCYLVLLGTTIYKLAY